MEKRTSSEIAFGNLLTSQDPIARLRALTTLRSTVEEQFERVEFELTRQAVRRIKPRKTWTEIGAATGVVGTTAERRFEKNLKRFE